MRIQLCGRRRFLRRVVSALVLACFFVVLSGIGIISLLPNDVENNFQGTASRKTAKNATRRFLTPLRVLWDTTSDGQQGTSLVNNVNFNESEVDEWQQANPESLDFKLLVYSAYWDNRTEPYCVRIIGTTLTKKSPNVICEFSLLSGEKLVMSAHKKAMNEHWNLLYAGFFFSCCSNKFSAASPPEWVSVSDNAKSNVSAKLKIHTGLHVRAEQSRNLALCVKPFHYNFNRAVTLVEFMEFYRMQGVEHFLFYNDSIGPDVELLLEKYQEEKLVTVLPWKMDVVNQKEIRTMNMFSALNDCVYRLMYRYKYVVSVDVDEFIVPRKHSNLSSLLVNLSTVKNIPCAASYVFQNAFFYLYWENDTTLFGVEPEIPPRNVPYLVTQYKTRRLNTPHNHGKRSKYIVVPLNTLEVGNHITWRHIGMCKPVKIPWSVGLLHHYRICEFGGFECLKLPSVVDRTAHRFGEVLLRRVLQRCRGAFPASSSGECPISPPLGSPW